MAAGNHITNHTVGRVKDPYITMSNLTKKGFRESLLNSGIRSVVVVSIADWRGGRQNKAILDVEATEVLTHLDAYDYIEFVGDTTDVVSRRNRKFWDFTDGVEIPRTLQNLVEEALQ